MNIRADIRALKHRQIKWALEQTKGSQRAAARLINCPAPTFDRWMRELNLGEYAEKMRRERLSWLAREVIRLR